jgi:DNA-binding response OmpR family regulator
MKIAIVDDDPPTLNLIGDFLQDSGYNVSRFSDPDELASGIKNFDAVIMDVYIYPDRIKGITRITEWVRDGIILPEHLVIFVSSFPREKEIEYLLDKLEKSLKFHWLAKNFLDTNFFDNLLKLIKGIG